ncbi:hypothetical protein Zm00014a_015035 [Zea mays]|uniref:Uncharacterized protein n=1 Tax=Zea mays TaxID=4577 RepID=A0A3L6G6S2_MAIZE|nr:hypothetical protein Zm00014a_015035 [Zea mays]
MTKVYYSISKTVVFKNLVPKQGLSCCETSLSILFSGGIWRYTRHVRCLKNISKHVLDLLDYHIKCPIYCDIQCTLICLVYSILVAFSSTQCNSIRMFI